MHRHPRLVGQVAGWLAVGLALAALGCGDDDDPSRPDAPLDVRDRFALETLPAIDYPPDNPPRPERVALGRLLFFDPLLGGERDVSCATCHHPDFGFADGRQLSVGVSGQGLGPYRVLTEPERIDLVPRNAPTVFNTAFAADAAGEIQSHLGLQFWDGRAAGLEEQAAKPIASRVEMRGDAIPGTDAEAEAAALDTVLTRLRSVPEYELRFRDAFPEVAADVAAGYRVSAVNSSTYVRAMAAYERELVTRNSPYDRFVRGDDDALDDEQRRGLELFFTTARCAECHSGPMFSDFTYVVQGVPQVGPGKDVIPGDDAGREEHTLDPADRYAFRTPTLRNVELTAPYMHDGALYSLDEVVRFYNEGAHPRHPACPDSLLDPRVRDPLGLGEDEVQAVVAFMRALTDPGGGLDPSLLRVPERVPSGLAPVIGLGEPGSGRHRPR